MSTKVSTLTAKIIWVVTECRTLTTYLTHENVTDRRVLKLLKTMDKCGAAAEGGEPINLIPDFARIDNHRIYWRSVASSIAAQASWLAPLTKEALHTFVAQTPSRLERSKYEITYDCFSSRIPQWRVDLAPFIGTPNLRFLEIGSFEGYSACWLLDNVLTHKSSQLVCIDTFADTRAASLFDRNIARTKGTARITKCIGCSQEELLKYGPDTFDFVYIDGGHEQVNVLEDGVFAWRLLKPGGLMTFDDYKMYDDPLYKLVGGRQRPEVAINAFLSVFEGHYRLLYKNYHVTLRKV